MKRFDNANRSRNVLVFEKELNNNISFQYG
jgi:hypothetical protein